MVNEDIGAMRFPDIPFMKRTFKLIEDLGFNDKLVDYVLSQDNNLNYFNGICLTNEELDNAGPDPFRTGVPGLSGSSGDMAGAQINPFKTAIKADMKKGWQHLMLYDKYSTRGFMTLRGQPNVGIYTDQVSIFVDESYASLSAP
jgi:hypothetical protein